MFGRKHTYYVTYQSKTTDGTLVPGSVCIHDTKMDTYDQILAVQAYISNEHCDGDIVIINNWQKLKGAAVFIRYSPG